MGALLQTRILARLVARYGGRSIKQKPEPEWKRQYRQLYGRDPPPWKFGNEPDVVVAWVREYVARKGRKPSLPEVQQVFRLPKTTAWRRVRDA
jgi:hypothetical protein